jgi:hypothetical protein
VANIDNLRGSKLQILQDGLCVDASSVIILYGVQMLIKNVPAFDESYLIYVMVKVYYDVAEK